MGVTKYLWNDITDTVAMEKDGAGNTTAVYASDPVPFGRLRSMRRGGTTYNYHFDGRGNATRLTDQTGKKTDAYTYDAFGTPRTATGSTANPYRYGGQHGYQYNPATDAYYVRARVYQPKRGRWRSKDPLRFVDGVNPYVYAGNGPTLHFDAIGQYAMTPASEGPPPPPLPVWGPTGRYKKCCGETAWLTIPVSAIILHGGDNRFVSDLQRANDVWRQCCTRFTEFGITYWGKVLTHRHLNILGFRKDIAGNTITENDFVLDHVIDIAHNPSPPSREEFSLTRHQSSTPHRIFAYYVKDIRAFAVSSRGRLLTDFLAGWSWAPQQGHTPPAPMVAVASSRGQAAQSGAADVLAHELGHIGGLVHVNEPGNLMYPPESITGSTRLTNRQCDNARYQFAAYGYGVFS